jgi:fluoroquinolone resistance protein
MNINDLKQRWASISNDTTAASKIKEFFLGIKTENKFSPFGITDKSFQDFRGVKFKEAINKYLKFENADFSYAIFHNTWLEKCIFNNCNFKKTDFTNYSDHGNDFIGCSFLAVKFNSAVIGYDGTKFDDCTFEDSIFTKAIFNRAEFTNCIFKNCKLKGVDFNASSFENCKFIGLLEDVWFKGGFQVEELNKEFGVPRKNKMLNVDFSEAKLVDLTISDGCDLSTIILPKTGHYQLFDNWKAYLEKLRKSISDWPENLRKEALFFYEAKSVHAKKQEWALINLDELKNEYGEDLANNILIALNA